MVSNISKSKSLDKDNDINNTVQSLVLAGKLVSNISESLSLDKDKDSNNNTVQSHVLAGKMVSKISESLSLDKDKDINNNAVQSRSKDLEAKKVGMQEVFLTQWVSVHVLVSSHSSIVDKI